MGLLKGLSAGKSKTLPDDPDGLVALLWDPSSDRKAVIAALVKIGAPAVEPLIKILEKPNIREVHRPVRDASATALANIGEPAAKALVRVFKLDPDLAEDALAALGPPVAELLVATLSEKNYYVRSRAACLLKGFGWQPRNDEERLLWDIACERWEEIDALSARLGASAIEPLNGALKNLRFILPNKKYEIATIAKALGHTRDVRAVEVLLTTLDYIGYHQPEIEREIKFALSELRNAHGVTVTEIILARRKQKESSATVVNLLMDLSWSWRAEDVPALLEALHDGTAEVRYWSAFALGRTKSRDTVEALVELLKDKSGFSLHAPGISVFNIEVPGTRSSSKFCIRQAAARALGIIGDPRAIKPLTKMLAEEKDLEIRAEAEWALKSHR